MNFSSAAISMSDPMNSASNGQRELAECANNEPHHGLQVAMKRWGVRTVSLFAQECETAQTCQAVSVDETPTEGIQHVFANSLTELREIVGLNGPPFASCLSNENQQISVHGLSLNLPAPSDPQDSARVAGSSYA